MKLSIIATLALFVLGCPSPEGSNNPTAAASDCRIRKTLAEVPPGYHTVSVKWNPGDERGDTVCIAKTEGKEIRFTNWLDAPKPTGYHVLYEQSGVDTSFRGCKTSTVFNGQLTCTESWVNYQMRKNE